MPLSTYAANNVLAHVCGQASWTKPTNTYFSLHTADPGLTGASEISAGWYARQLASWNAATTSGATNNGIHVFPTVTGSNVTVTHIGIWDALTTGNFLFSIDVTDTLFVVGAAPKIADAAVTITPGVAYSNYLIPLITDHLSGKAAMTFDSSMYVAMYTTNPTQADSGTEVSTGGYARQLIEFDATVSGATDNTNIEAFPTATANLGTLTHCAIRAALTVGNMHLFGALTSSATVNNGDDYQFAAGDLDFTT